MWFERTIGSVVLAMTWTWGCAVDGQSRGSFGLDGAGFGTTEASEVGSSEGSVTEGTETTAQDGDTGEDEPGSSESSSTATSGESPTADCSELGPWVQSDPFEGTSHPLPAFAVGSWFYVHTQADGARPLLSAQAQADGTLGPWQVASEDHGGGPHGHTALAIGGEAFHFRNGHIARYVLTDDGLMVGDVELLEDDVTAAFGGDRYVWDSAVPLTTAAGPSGVLHLGGYSFTVSDYRQRVMSAPWPLGSRFAEAGPDHPAVRPGKASLVQSPGDGARFVFLRDGAEGQTLFRTEIDAAGSVGSWEEGASLPGGTGNQRGDMFTVGSTLVVVQGSTVWAADCNDAGQLGPWIAQPDLPQAQVDVHWGEGHLEGSTWGIIGDYVYVTGADRVFMAELVPRPCEPGPG